MIVNDFVRKLEKHIRHLVLNVRDLARHLAFDLTFVTGSSGGNATSLALLRHSLAFTSIRRAGQRTSGKGSLGNAGFDSESAVLEAVLARTKSKSFFPAQGQTRTSKLWEGERSRERKWSTFQLARLGTICVQLDHYWYCFKGSQISMLRGRVQHVWAFLSTTVSSLDKSQRSEMTRSLNIQWALVARHMLITSIQREFKIISFLDFCLTPLHLKSISLSLSLSLLIFTCICICYFCISMYYVV